MDNSWLRYVPKELQSLLLEDLLQSSLVGINITDGEGRVLFLNDIHRKITGHDPVSYTHLDVYKRQLQIRKRIMKRNISFASFSGKKGAQFVNVGLR